MNNSIHAWKFKSMKRKYLRRAVNAELVQYIYDLYVDFINAKIVE